MSEIRSGSPAADADKTDIVTITATDVTIRKAFLIFIVTYPL
ncbi:MAG: hypothetical protein ABFD57_10525 [Smithella sp.]